MTKGEKFGQRYDYLDKDWTNQNGDESANMDMDQEGATLKNRGGSKFMDKRSTQVGGASS
jgi:hypothetical protein